MSIKEGLQSNKTKKGRGGGSKSEMAHRSFLVTCSATGWPTAWMMENIMKDEVDCKMKRHKFRSENIARIYP